MKKLVKGIILALILTSPVSAQELSFSGDLSTLWGITAPGTKKSGFYSTGDTEFSGIIKASLDKGMGLIEGFVSYDTVAKKIDSGIDEAYIDYADDNWGFRIGYQKAAWGKADGVEITNSVFPVDQTTLYNNSLAINAARLSFYGDTYAVDAFWIPFFSGSLLPLAEGNPLRKAVVPESITIDDSGTKKDVPIKLGKLNTPELKIQNSEYALKVSGYLPACDFSLYGFYGWDKNPTLSYVSIIPTSITINGEYQHMSMIGFDAAFPIKATVLRVETAFFPQRAFQSSTESILNGGSNFVKQNQLMSLIGIDWMPNGWTITAQYYCDVIINKSDNLERDMYQHGATINVSKNFFDETLELGVSAAIGLKDFDSALTFSGLYNLSDQIELTVGTFVFLPGPFEDGNYGALKDLSTIYLEAKYKF